MFLSRHGCVKKSDKCLATGPPALHVEMEMVAMRGIIVGTERRSEQIAGAVMRSAKECALVGRIAPGFEDRQVAAIGSGEPCDIDGVRCGMLAPGAALPSVEATAVIGAEVTNTGNLGAEDVTSGRPDDASFPNDQCRSDRT